MNPATLGVLVPIVAIGGFFAWMIAIAVGKMYTERLKAHPPAAAGVGHEDVHAAVDDLRHEVAELAERVDFTERLLAKQREADKLAPPPPQ